VFAPADAEQLGLTWTSSDNAIAYVDSNNMLHSLAPGNAVLTATNEASGLTATINVTVTAVLYGDANDDNSVTIEDAATEVMYILEQKPQTFSFKKADVNRDRRINVADVSGTVNIILTQPYPAEAPVRLMSLADGDAAKYLKAENVVFDSEGRAVMTLALEPCDNFTGLQGDVRPPEGVHVSGVALAGSQTGDHTTSYAMVDDNTLRFVIYSLSLSDVNTGTGLLNISLDCDDTFTSGEAISANILSVDRRGNSRNSGAFTTQMYKASVGIDNIINDSAISGDIYNLQGICLKRNATTDDVNALHPGVYIINGRNVLVK